VKILYNLIFFRVLYGNSCTSTKSTQAAQKSAILPKNQPTRQKASGSHCFGKKIIRNNGSHWKLSEQKNSRKKSKQGLPATRSAAARCALFAARLRAPFCARVRLGNMCA
jgi:hypothetical protein